MNCISLLISFKSFLKKFFFNFQALNLSLILPNHIFQSSILFDKEIDPILKFHPNIFKLINIDFPRLRFTLMLQFRYMSNKLYILFLKDLQARINQLQLMIFRIGKWVIFLCFVFNYCLDIWIFLLQDAL